MLTDTLAGLLATICREPGNIDARLVYADCCEESGDVERAEFIRVQCRLHSPEGVRVKCGRIRSRPWCSDPECHWCDLNRRERDLLAANFGGWTDCLPDTLVTKQCPHCADQQADWETGVVECRRCECTGVVSDPNNIDFRRGFVEQVECSCADWLKHGPAIVLATPVVQVTLSDVIEWHGGQPCVMRGTLKVIYRVAFPDRLDAQGVYDSDRARLERQVFAAALLWARTEAKLN